MSTLCLRLFTGPCLVFTLILLAGCEADKQAASSINYHLLGPCEVPAESRFKGLIGESLCGEIPVLEDPDRPEGRMISLNLMLLPATTAPVKPDPIFFLAGGPGQSAVEFGPGLFSRLAKLRADRDIVLIDQRGTGESNPISCHLDEDTQSYVLQATNVIDRLQIETLRVCLDEFDGDAALYTTPIAMDDLDKVRRILGYEKINLYGISYGTRAALVYMRRHGDSVRSAILDGVAPLDMVVSQKFGLDAEDAMDLLFGDCAAEPACSHAYPDLEAHFDALLRRLSEHPEAINLKHPKTGLPVTGFVDAQLIARVSRNILYNRTLSRLLPEAIEAAYRGDYTVMFSLAERLSGGGLAIGMMASVLCAEDMLLTNGPQNGPRFENPLYEILSQTCEFWPKRAQVDNYFEPLVSDIPVLLTSGELDPVTPPKYAERAASRLSRSKHLIIKGVGHGATLAACMPSILGQFLEQASVDGLDTSCLDTVKRPAFFIGPGGPILEEMNDV